MLYSSKNDIVESTPVSDRISVGRTKDGKIMTIIDGKPFVQCRGATISGTWEEIADRYRDATTMDEILAMRTSEEILLDQFVENRHSYITAETEMFVHASNLQAWFENDYNLDIVDSRIGFPILKELSRTDDLAKKLFSREIERRVTDGTTSSITALVMAIGTGGLMKYIPPHARIKLVDSPSDDIREQLARDERNVDILRALSKDKNINVIRAISFNVNSTDDILDNIITPGSVGEHDITTKHLLVSNTSTPRVTLMRLRNDADIPTAINASARLVPKDTVSILNKGFSTREVSTHSRFQDLMAKRLQETSNKEIERVAYGCGLTIVHVVINFNVYPDIFFRLEPYAGIMSGDQYFISRYTKTVSTLNRLLLSDDPWVRRNVALNEKTPPSTIEHIVKKDREHLVRLQAWRNPSCPASVENPWKESIARIEELLLVVIDVKRLEFRDRRNADQQPRPLSWLLRKHFKPFGGLNDIQKKQVTRTINMILTWSSPRILPSSWKRYQVEVH